MGLCSLFWIGHAAALQIDPTQPPYYASPSLSDNGPAFHSAIQALLAGGGGTLYIPAGIYKILTPIVITDTPTQYGSLIIRGDGPHLESATGSSSMGTDLVWLGTGSVDAITMNATSSYDAAHFTLRDLTLSGAMPPIAPHNYTGANQNGLTLINTGLFLIDNVLVEGFHGAGISITASYPGSVQNSTITSCGVGVYCSQSTVVSFSNVTALYNYNGFQNPVSLISCTIKDNDSDGIIYNEAYIKASVRDCWFEANNYSDKSPGADIYGNNITSGWSSIDLLLDGHNVFVARPAHTNFPYRYLRGEFYYMNKSGATLFPIVSQWAMVDLTETRFQESSAEHYPGNLTWLYSSNSGNTYTLWNVPQTIATQPN